MNRGSQDSSRRVTRKRNKPQKYGDFLETTKRKVEVESESSEEDEEFDEEQCHQKPSALFSNDDVEGQDMFKFKTRHTKLDLQNKVKSVISSSPKVPDEPMKTPRRSYHRGSFASPMSKASEPTPKHVKDIMKKRIIKEVESGSESDFSDGSSDEFVPDEDEEASENESEPHSSAASSSEPEGQEKEETKPAIKIVKNKDARKPKDSEYIVTPDNYFMMHSSKKITTSDHTLSRLKNMNLNDSVDEENHLTDEHKTKITELNRSYEQLFDKWLYVFNENFNVILYGIGSKRPILQQFQAEKLQDFPCVVINGFFPSLTMKSILETIVVDLLENSSIPSNIGDVVNLIDSQLTRNGIELFLIVHNIDGPMLRNGKAQAMLASLSHIRNVHTIASIDHINAPLLWDHSKLSKLKWSWWDATSFLPYGAETAYESALGPARAARTLASLRAVLASLTSNARGVYRLLLQHQLDHNGQPHYQGLPFAELYRLSREQFLASSVVSLRAQLREFLDHRLLRSRRAADGAQLLHVPARPDVLREALGGGGGQGEGG